jgi:hypothetical protein
MPRDEKYLNDAREAYEKLPRANRGFYLTRQRRVEHAKAQLDELMEQYRRCAT